jgi:hypothetical protein
MNCPECGWESVVINSRPAKDGRLIRRRRACRCGARWTTAEKRISPVVMSYLPGRLDTSPGGKPPQDDVPKLPEKAQEFVAPVQSLVLWEGVGGGSVSENSESSSGLIRIPSSYPVEIVRSARARSRNRANDVEYSPEFERFWEHTGKCHGNKGPAAKAFEAALSRVSLAQLEAAWTAYMSSSGPARGYVQNVSTWLNGDGYETNWQPATSPVQQQSGYARRVESDDDFLRRVIDEQNEQEAARAGRR